MTVEERVAAGTAWLDEKVPDWWQTHKFSLDIFDLTNGCRCVVGQLAPDNMDYGEAIDYAWLDLTDSLAWDLGFFAGEPETDDETIAMYAALEDEWVRVITERREVEK